MLFFNKNIESDDNFQYITILRLNKQGDVMAVGYVLVNVTPGMEIEAYHKIKSMKNVDDITVLFGDYDLIVKLVADDLVSIAKSVVETIRPVKGVLNTKTLAGADII